MKNNIIEWIKNNFVTYQDFEDYTLAQKQRYRDLQSKILQIEKREKVEVSNIDLEMFGVKLFRARLVNISKSILISVLTIGIVLYFIMRWFQ